MHLDVELRVTKVGVDLGADVGGPISGWRGGQSNMVGERIHGVKFSGGDMETSVEVWWEDSIEREIP